MGQISKETIEQVRQATDIVELIQSYIPVKRAGSAYKANCPFHHEKTPSFHINPARQSFHCFGCGKGGDSIAFVREYENLPFTDAVKRLAQRAGIAVQEETLDPEEEKNRKSRGRLLDLLRETAAFLHERLMRDPAAAHARAYMKSRGFGGEMAKRWSVGWMPRNSAEFLAWARERKFSGRELYDSGMAGMKNADDPREGLYVRFTDRLMFPIRNEMGDVIAFSGRKLREDQQGGKYQNSPETPVFHKSRVLFALDRAKRPILAEKCALICEGQIDAIACHEAGVAHAIATQGTALTEQHARVLKRFTKDVVLSLDADGAGLAATEKAFRVLAAEGFAVRVAAMPVGEDPDSFLKKNGADAFRGLLANATDFFDFKLDLAKRQGRLENASDNALVLSECAEMLALMDDKAAQEVHLKAVATRLLVSGNHLREEITRLKKRERMKVRNSAREENPESEEMAPAVLHRVVSFLCERALASVEAQHFLAEQFETLHEALPWVEGVAMLEKILVASPDPRSPAAVNAFLDGLPAQERLALLGAAHAEFAPAEEFQAVEHALSHLSAIVLQKRDAAVKAALKEPGVTPERMFALLAEAKEISALMREMHQRFHFDDELPPSTFKAPEPEWKRRWRERNSQ